MISSIRTRLTLWHTSVLGALLCLFAAAAYAFVRYSTRAATDRELTDAVTELATQLSLERDEQPSTPATATEVVGELRSLTTAFAVYDRRGHVLAFEAPRHATPVSAEDDGPAFDPATLAPIVANAARAPLTLVTVGDAEGGYRAALRPLDSRDGVFLVAAVQSLHGEAETLGNARLAMLVAIPAALLLAWLGGWELARRSLAPMTAIRDQAARIGASNLADRVPVAKPDDEVGRLAGVINDLLARLERSFVQQRDFMADASHELRTPVAVIQNEASRALSRADRDPAEYEEALIVVRDAARRLRRIVDDLFMLARADAGELPLRHDLLYVDEVVADCAREARSLADARGVDVVLELPPSVAYHGDEALLHRLVLNLLDNAIKHSPAGARVTLRLHVTETGLQLEVEDNGAGIPAALQPRIFDRFVRGDAARAHDEDSMTSGAGLGLAIARWIAQAHRGTLELASSDTAGTRFVLRLPADS